MAEFYSKEFWQLERKLKLITNLDVIIPSFVLSGTLRVGEKDIKIEIGNFSTRYSFFNILETNRVSQDKVVERFRMNIDFNSFYETVEGQSKHACDMFFASFDVHDNQIAFVLLFSSLESLFNSAGKQIAENLGEMVSKLLRLSTISKTKSMKFKN